MTQTTTSEKVQEKSMPDIDLRDPFTFDTLQRTDYQNEDSVNTNSVISDMQRLMAYTNNPYLFYVKTLEKGNFRIQVRGDKDMAKTLKSILIGEEIAYVPTGKDKNGKMTFRKVSNPVSLYQIFNDGVGLNANKLKFLVRDVKFISNEPNVLSVFRGYPYKPIDSVKLPLIQPFLDHVQKIICNNNLEVFEFILNWIAFIIQNPGEKCETALLLISDQGCGKNVFFTDIICKLVEGYAISNETKIDNIIGRFNTSLENNVLVVCNELQSVENVRYLNSDALKSLITEKTIRYDSKYVNVRDGENVSNFIFVSNNIIPLRIETGDRRYVVTHCSNEVKGNNEYFDKLHSTFTKKFYKHLFTFFLNRDLSKWNKRLIPATDLRNDLIDSCKESWLRFFEDNIDAFYEDGGYNSQDCYNDYLEFCDSNGDKHPFSLTKSGLRIKQFVTLE